MDLTAGSHQLGRSCGQSSRLTLMCLAAYFDFVALHDLLYCIPDVAHPDVDTCFLRLSERCNQNLGSDSSFTRTPVFVASFTASNSRSHVGSKFMVKAESTIRPLTWTPKSTFITSPFCSTIIRSAFPYRRQGELALDIPSIWRIMGRHLIHAQPRRKAYTTLQTTLFDQTPRPVLDELRNFSHCHARFYRLAGVFANLTVNLGRTTDVLVVGS